MWHARTSLIDLKDIAMNRHERRGKLRPDDLFSLEQYARQRPEFRPKVIAHKRVPARCSAARTPRCVSRTA